MAINSTSSAVTLQGNGATNTWPYAFKIPGASATDQTFVIVTVVDTTVTPAIITVLAANQYSINGVNTDAGGLVSYPLSGANPPVGVFVTVQRALTPVQSTSIPNQSAFLPAVVEAALDYLTMLSQQIITAQGRSIQAAVSDSGGNPAVIPDASVRKNSMAIWDANGNLGAGAQASVVVNAAMFGLVQAASLAAARSFLGSGLVGDALFTAATKAAALATLGILSDPQAFTGAATFSGGFTVKDVTAGAGAGPVLTALRDKGAAGVAADLIGDIHFDGKNSANAQKTFSRIVAKILDPTSTLEDGAIVAVCLVNGAAQNAITIGPGLQAGAPTGGDKGLGTVNAAAGVYDNGVRLNGGAFTAKAMSGLAAITLAAGGTFTHGLGAMPASAALLFVNITAEFGYAVGDIALISCLNASSVGDGYALAWNSTVVKWMIGLSHVEAVSLLTGDIVVLTPTSWQVKVLAWL